MKKYEGDDLIIELQEVMDVLSVMAVGIDAYRDSAAASCMNMIHYRLEEIAKKIKEMSGIEKESKNSLSEYEADKE